MKSRCFRLYRAYSISFNSSNVGNFFWRWILTDCIDVQKVHSYLRLVVDQSFHAGKSESLGLGLFCQSKPPIAFMPLSLKSPSSLLPNPATATATRTSQEQYRKSSIKPLGCIFISNQFGRGGGLNRDGELIWAGGLFDLEQMMVSVPSIKN